MTLIRRYPLLAFTAVVLALQTLSVWVEVQGLQWDLFFRARIYQAGVVTLAFIYILDGKQGLRELAASCFKVRLAWYWYAFAIVIPVVIGVLPQITLWSLGLIKEVEYDTYFLNEDWRFWKWIVTLAFVEEIAWIGFAWKKLTRYYTPFLASLFGGVLWGIYYIPLNEAGLQLPAVFPTPAMIIHLMSIAALCAWLYGRTKSTALLTLMQAVMNFTALTFPVRPTPEDTSHYYIFVGSKLVFALFLFLKFGPKPLFGRAAEQEVEPAHDAEIAPVERPSWVTRNSAPSPALGPAEH
jgi:membrane protease YdiL (CAAX protease family)